MKDQPSASALNVARCRAIAAHETRKAVQGADYLAEIFLDEPARQSLKDPAVHPIILKKLDEFSPGSYEYFIARTAYLDGVVKQALLAQVPQLVFLGAGYDTRACRFSDLLINTQVFELDAPTTQAHKQALLRQENISIPKQLAFIPIDFSTDSLLDKLSAAGYAVDKQTLFVWEGVSYYLSLSAVEATLQFIQTYSPPGSILCFDYMLPASQLEGRYGAQQARAAMEAIYTAEPLQFDLDEAQVADFLSRWGFELCDHLTAEQMQTRFLMLEDGTPAGPVLDLFCLAQARVTER